MINNFTFVSIESKMNTIIGRLPFRTVKLFAPGKTGFRVTSRTQHMPISVRCRMMCKTWIRLHRIYKRRHYFKNVKLLGMSNISSSLTGEIPTKVCFPALKH